MLYTKMQPTVNPNLIRHYKKHLGKLDMTGIRNPVEISDIAKFERQNPDFSVNVYVLNNRKDSDRGSKLTLFLLYNTKERHRKYHTNLLLIKSADKAHYVNSYILLTLLKLSSLLWLKLSQSQIIIS